MTPPNLNKLFPRLSIRAKLVVTLGLLATLQLVVMGAFGCGHKMESPGTRAGD